MRVNPYIIMKFNCIIHTLSYGSIGCTLLFYKGLCGVNYGRYSITSKNKDF